MPRFYSAITVSLLCCLLLLPPTVAQDTAEGWPVVQRCIEVQSLPPNWHYEGTIFTLGADENVRGMRADLDTSYIIAFGGENFTSAGTISPDGRWFAVPGGRVGDYSSNMRIERFYYVDKLRVFSTGIAQQSYELSWEGTYVGSDVWVAVLPIEWIDNEHLLYDQGRVFDISDIFSINPFTGEVQLIDDSPVYRWISPDGTHAFTRVSEESYGLYDFEQKKVINTYSKLDNILWKPDSTEFVATTRIPNSLSKRLSIYDRDGNLTEEIASSINVTYESGKWSPDGRFLLFNSFLLSADNTERRDILFLADTQEKRLVDTCMNTYRIPSSVWSDSNRQVAAIAFVNGQPTVVIVDLNDYLAYNLNLEAIKVLDWRPEDE